jgi:hypothetical protein
MESGDSAHHSVRLQPEVHGQPAQPSLCLLPKVPGPPERSIVEARPRRTIYAGDTIQYCSPAFVVGSREGLREAVVVAVDPVDPAGRTVRINGFELLTPETWLTVVKDRSGQAVKEKWSMNKHWSLVAGRVSARSRQSIFNERLRGVVEQSFAAVRRRLAAGPCEESELEPSTNRGNNDEDDDYETEWHQGVCDELPQRPEEHPTSLVPPMDAASLAFIEHQAVKQTEEVAPADLESFEDLMTLAQRRAKHHRGKDKHGTRTVSRKRRHKKMRKVSRDSQNVYHAIAPETIRLQTCMHEPAAKLALRQHRKERSSALIAAPAALDDDFVPTSGVGDAPDDASDASASSRM